MKIEQMLHGYDNGHRLLAGSVLLKYKGDMDAIAILSDWSEYIATDGGDSSYVTAYPLKHSGYYVIAKTWYADEMQRPGCVWTHSLLIPLDELNNLDDFSRIKDLFERPDKEKGFDAYSRAFQYEIKEIRPDSYQSLVVDRGLVSLVMHAFLARQATAYLAADIETYKMDNVMLAVMNMMPQGMLESLSWCTGTSYLRKLNGRPMTVQVVSRSTEVKETHFNVSEEPWMSYVVDAIMRGDVNQGQLLRMFSGDIGDSSEYYAAIVKVLYTLEDYLKYDNTLQERYIETLAIVSKAFPAIASGRIIKKLLVNKGFASRYCQEDDFFLLFSTLDINGVFDTKETGVDEWLNEFSGRARKNYISLLGKICCSENVNEWGQQVLKESGNVLLSEELTEIAIQDSHLFNTQALLNPRVLDKLLWTELTDSEVEALLPMLLDSRTQSGFTQWENLFFVLLEKGMDINSQLAKVIFVKNRRATHNLLDYLNGDEQRYTNYALTQELKLHESEILTWLSGAYAIKTNVAYLISCTVDEHSRGVAMMGAKLWRAFLGLHFQNLNSDIYAFLFALSFNWPNDRDAIQLMRVAFYPLHVLQASNNLGYGNWSRISPYMESLIIWDDWDKCKKMRKTVVKRLQLAGMSENALDSFTPDNELNEKLKRLW